MLEKGEASFNRRFKRYIDRCKLHGTIFSLTKEEFKHICEQDCCYCGQPPTSISSLNHKKLNGQWACNTLDRVSSKLGYVRGNVVPCCMACNTMKSDMDVEKFIAKVWQIAKHLEPEPLKG